jgi:addiction module RelB/DinJ family antitoxin
MTATNINISLGDGLGAKAQAVLADLGLDVPTAINMFLTQVVDHKALPFTLPLEGEEPIPAQEKIPFSELYGCFKGKIWMADDFDAPLPVGTIEPDPTKVPKPGCMRGQIWMADDFDAPMEEFKEYM